MDVVEALATHALFDSNFKDDDVEDAKPDLYDELVPKDFMHVRCDRPSFS